MSGARSIGLCLVAAALVASACANPVESCEQLSAVAGRWSYRATRESPGQGTITGLLQIESPNCVDLNGSMDVVEVLATGESRRIAGPISGTIIDSGHVRFEAQFGSGSREHFARIGGDSLSGAWLEIAGSNPGSGPFSGRRE
jgi:hypothetical protein